MRKFIMAGAAALCLLPVAANAMTVDQLLAKVDALKARGAMAMFSSDIGVLKEEVNNAVTAWRADKAARKAAGKPPLACAPEGSKMNSDEMIAAFRALPPAQRRQSVREGFARVIIAKYPCH